ncbi:hypothetical protein DI53_2780 [Sphingobacterium deserti]|uniref:Uncharacterized protein n=1 Tax=Sphingobacterium deserti TaxID=1229276 RepID=A0A0B8T023_9SPHI|nr:hypothetical protein DI53_2780 [Sphingobacterium deserti]
MEAHYLLYLKAALGNEPTPIIKYKLTSYEFTEKWLIDGFERQPIFYPRWCAI